MRKANLIIQRKSSNRHDVPLRFSLRHISIVLFLAEQETRPIETSYIVGTVYAIKTANTSETFYEIYNPIQGDNMLVTISALIFIGLTLVVIIFQACLAAGLPWGAASMGGKFPGKYPLKMRIAAISNIFILSFMATIVLSRAELILPGLFSFSKIAIWVAVVFYIAGTIMNTITPSKIERIWAPVSLILLATSVIIALG
jgi:hypothetical protein